MEQTNETKGITERRLKIYPKHHPRERTKHVIVPEIRLCGKWLAQQGFEWGEFVSVQCMPDKIIITPLVPAPSEPAPAKKKRATRSRVARIYDYLMR